MKKSITVADLVMGVGGIVAFVFSFMAFFKQGSFTVSAWDGDAGAFATTVPALLGLAMAVWIGLELAGVSLPEEVLTFNTAQLKATWGISAAGIMLSWLSADFGGADKGVGYWLMFVGSAAMAAGSVMALLGKGTDTINLGGDGASSLTAAADAPASPEAPAAEPPAPSGDDTGDQPG